MCFTHDLVGNRVSIPPSHQVILGRAGDIRLGADDPAMHRHFLQLWNQQGAWYIRNVGSFITARIISRGQNRFAPQRLSPRTTLPLPPGEVGITFDTKHMAYEIALINAAPPPRYAVTPVPDVPFTAEGFEPNAEQLQLLRALAEPLWRDPAAEPHLVVPRRARSALQAASRRTPRPPAGEAASTSPGARGGPPRTGPGPRAHRGGGPNAARGEAPPRRHPLPP